MPRPLENDCRRFRSLRTRNMARGLKAFTTINKAIGLIQRSDRDWLHNLDKVKKFSPPLAPYNGDKLARTICTGAGEVPHPNGTRDVTLREYACLQGFPISHRFFRTRTQVKRQIGNAFPPNTVEVLYKHIREWLAKEDGSSPAQVDEDVIMIDSDSDSEGSPIQDRYFARDLSPDMDDVIMIDDEEQAPLSDRRVGFVARNGPLVIDLT